MSTNPNIMQFVQLVRMQKNPRQMVMNILQQQSSNNPIVSNLLQMAQSGDTKGIEQVARNIMQEKGLDFDAEFNNFKRNLGF